MCNVDYNYATSIQLMLEEAFTDDPLNFVFGLIQLTFHTTVFPNACNGDFISNVTTFQSNYTEGLDFSVFHFILYYILYYNYPILSSYVM